MLHFENEDREGRSAMVRPSFRVEGTKSPFLQPLGEEGSDSSCGLREKVESGGEEGFWLLMIVVGDQALPGPGISDFSLELREQHVYNYLREIGLKLEDVA